MKKQLRKCLIDYMANEIFYFHKWAEEGRKKLHPENPSGDLVYAETYALCENIKTGQIHKTDPDAIRFINEFKNKAIPELSDEEIEKAFTIGSGFQKTVYSDRIEGAKWYREQLKQRQ